MITIPEIVEKIIKKSSFLEEGLSKKIINLSALSRIIKPEIEKELYKKVENGAIIMALKRLSSRLDHRNSINKIFINAPDLIVRSNLIEYTLANSQSLIPKHQKLLEIINRQKEFFSTITEGVFETTLIVSLELESSIKKIYKDEKVIFKVNNLSSITIRLPKENIDLSGVYYFILKPLAWEEINILEVVSTTHEITLIFGEKDIDRAFLNLKNLFNK
ncbi:Aspartate kinase [Candidatus Roizmanbacteria bacterium]|nr:Aspartate kinase [Candidatus Roizmanbacteria bacterium]